MEPGLRLRKRYTSWSDRRTREAKYLNDRQLSFRAPAGYMSPRWGLGTLMLIELPAAELLDKSPERRAHDVLAACLKQPPPEHFLVRYAEAIRQDDLGFLQRFLGQWPGAFRSTIAGPQRGMEAMKPLEEIISTRFLMAVPSEQFLEIAYREFFDRDLDDAGRGEFGG